jgi:hypothetical protein
MSDILADYREWRSHQENRIGTHSEECHLWPRHERCMIHRLAAEVERLRQVTSQENLTLTAEEREAVERAVAFCECTNAPLPTSDQIATLRGLLERTGGER